MSRVKEGHSFVDCLLDDFNGVASHFLRFRNQNGINYVNDPIGSLDVSLDDLGLVDLKSLAGWLDRKFRAVYRFGRIELSGLLGFHFAFNDVVGKDAE